MVRWWFGAHLNPPDTSRQRIILRFDDLNGYGCKGQLAMDLITQVSDATGTINTIQALDGGGCWT